MSHLDADAFRAISKRPRTVSRHELPDYGVFYVRKLTSAEWDWHESNMNKRSGKKTVLNLEKGGLRARFAMLVLSNADGEPLFNQETRTDSNMLGECPSDLLDAIWDAGYEVNGMAHKNGKDPEKNSEETAD